MVQTYGKTAVGGTESNVNYTRCHSIPANTLASDETVLKSISIHCGTDHNQQVRLALYQGGSVTNPSGATLIRDFGQTSGTATNTLLTLNAADETIDPTDILWVVWKGTSSGGDVFNVVYDDGGGPKGDWYAPSGRFSGTGFNNSETVAFPGTFPGGGSAASTWYTASITVDTAGPSIQNCVPSITLLPTSTGVIATGSTFGSVQTTSEIQLGDDADYSLATLVDQTVNSWSDTSIDFDVVLGGLAEGDLFLFVVIDPGGGGEESSIGFPVNVRAADDKYAYLRLVTQAGAGDQDLLGVGFRPTAALIVYTSNESQNTAETDQRQHHYIWTEDFQAISSGGHETGGATINRHQALGDLVIRNGGISTNVAVATVTSLADGLRFAWSNPGEGYTLHCLLFGGTVTPFADNIAANSSPITNMQFPLQLLFAVSTGAAAVPDSSSESTTALGIASGTAAGNQIVMRNHAHGATTTIGILQTGIFCGQLINTTSQWSITLSAINNDGWEFSGDTDADVFQYLALHFRGLQVNVGSFTKDSSGTPGATQQIGSQGFEPGFAMFLNAHRTSQALTASDMCQSVGMGEQFGPALQGSYLITDETSDNADEATHTSGMVRGGFVNAVSDAIGSVTTWADNPTVTWSTNDTVAAIVGYLTIETEVFDQDITQDPTPFVGIVPEPDELIATADIIQTPNPFVGIVDAGDMLIALSALVTQTPAPFVGIVPEPGSNVVLLINDYDDFDIPGGLVGFHRIVVDDSEIGPTNPMPFVGIVPNPTLPVPGNVDIEQPPFSFVGIVPEPTLIPAAQDITQDPIGFVGIVPGQGTGTGMTQDPGPFVGIVPDQTVAAGDSPDIEQDPTPFVGIVPTHAIQVGAGSAGTTDPFPFVGIVPEPNVVSLIQQDPTPFVGIVPDPATIDPLASPNIVQLPTPFVGIVPGFGETSIAQNINQLPTPFVGIVPQPRGVVLRDASTRRIHAAETI